MKKYWKSNISLVALFVLFVFLSEGLTTYIAWLYGRIVDIARTAEHSQLPGYFILLITVSILMPICFFAYSFFIQKFRVIVQNKMKQRLFGSILDRDYREYIKNEKGSYLSSYSSEIESLDASYFFSVYGILQIISNFIFAEIILFVIHPKFALYNLFGVLPAIVIPSALKKTISRLQTQKIEKNAKNIAALNEYLSAVETILLFGRQSKFSSMLKKQNSEIMMVSRKIPKLMNLTTNLAYMMLQLYYCIIIYIAVINIASGKITVGMFIAAIQILGGQNGVAFTSHYIQQFFTSRKTLENIKKMMSFENSQKGAKTANDISEIEYKNVTFSFDASRPIIKEFSHKFNKKGVYQIVGSSGSGKSTLMNLLCGYIAADSGSISISGIDNSELSNLNNLITVMRQESIFFEGSLRENLTMFSDIPLEEINSRLHSIGLELGGRLDDTNMNFSGGEARRIMLIRSLLRNTKILILDEPLAGLDSESVALVEKEISKISDRYVFVVTHQPLSIPVIETIEIQKNK